MRRPTTPETAVKRAITHLLKAHGIPSVSLPQGLGSPAGLPDKAAFHRGQTWWIEVKTDSPKSRQSPAQVEFEAMLARHGVPYILARSPEDVAEAMGLKVLFGARQT